MSDNESESDVEVAAATKIQSVFKGHKARQEYALQKSQSSVRSDDDAGDSEAADPESAESSEQQFPEEQHQAATTIQAQFRGYSTRKRLKVQDILSTTRTNS